MRDLQYLPIRKNTGAIKFGIDSRLKPHILNVKKISNK